MTPPPPSGRGGGGMTPLYQEILDEFDKVLEHSANVYGTTYPPNPELKSFLLQALRKQAEEIIGEISDKDLHEMCNLSGIKNQLRSKFINN